MTRAIGTPPSFQCTSCGAKTDVKDSRPTTFQNKPSIRRRRRCRQCGKTVTTYEVADNGQADNFGRTAAIILQARRANRALTELITRYDGAEAQEETDA